MTANSLKQLRKMLFELYLFLQKNWCKKPFWKNIFYWRCILMIRFTQKKYWIIKQNY